MLRITKAQHMGGLLFWNDHLTAPTLHRSGARNELVAEGRLSDGNVYRFLGIPLGFDDSIEFGSRRAVVGEKPIARYEQLHESGEVVTAVFEFHSKQLSRIHLRYVPEYGHFHRLVVEGGNIEWSEDHAMRMGKDTVRFVDGMVDGPWRNGISRESGDQTNYEAVFDLRDAPLAGRFIEIVANGDDAKDARRRALAYLGYFNLIFGPGSYGVVRIDAEITALRKQPEHYRLVGTDHLGFRVQIDDAALERCAKDFDQLAGMRGRSLGMKALERYGQGCRSVEDELAFGAMVAGIDRVVSDFYSSPPGKPVRDRLRESADLFISRHLSSANPEEQKKIKSSLTFSSFADKFSFYVERVNLKSNFIDKFKDMKDTRDALFHGTSSDEVARNVAAAKDILAAVICHEASIDRRSIWRLDRRVNTMVDFKLPGMGWPDRDQNS